MTTPAWTNLVELARSRAATTPEKIIYRFLAQGEVEEATLSYAELDQRARAIAAVMQARGLSGQRVLLLFPPGLDYIASFFGCLYAGAVAVPIYPPHPRRLDRLFAVAADAKPVAALTQDGLLAKLQFALGGTPLWKTVQWFATDTIGSGEASGWREPSIDGRALAFLQYTSGSTSTPKGVMLSHGNLLHNEALIHQAFETSSDSYGMGWLPLYHDMGLIGNVLQPMYADFPIALMSPVDFVQNPYRWLAAISKYRATHSGGPSFAYALCMSRITQEQRATLDLSSWQVAFCGAERIDADVANRFASSFAPHGFRREAFFPCYGLAEASLMVTGSRAGRGALVGAFQADKLAQGSAEAGEGEHARALVGCGRVLSDQRVLVVDRETHAVCRDGAIGEIWVAGDSVAQGYFERPEQTEATFGARVCEAERALYPESFLRTGDLGFFAEGELYITGRAKDLIIVCGRNHAPEDIECDVFPLHEALRRGSCAAFSVPEEGQERLVIVQEVRRNLALDVEALAKALKQKLFERHDLPLGALVLIGEGTLPKTSSGKIQRGATRDAFLRGELKVLGQSGSLSEAPEKPVAAPSVAPPVPAPAAKPQEPAHTASELRTLMVEFLISRLNKPATVFSDDEPLSSYGLSSVVAIELASQMSQWVKREVSPTILYDYPTIGALVSHLSGEARALPACVPAASSEAKNCAIVGMACRFPGAHDLEAYWELLVNGNCAITRTPSDRFAGQQQAVVSKAPACAGHVENPYHFDAAFFGIAPHVGIDMDPQQRLLLEVTWEALEHAGIPAQDLAGSRTGVFVGISTSDYAQLTGGPLATEPTRATGNAHSIAANRISYTFDLRGPSIAVDTACSSSLTALHLAVCSLERGECDLAIVGGVNLILDATVSGTLSEAGMLAPDGKCKTFDARADGYARGEGCGVVVLRLAEAARARGNEVHALVLGSALNQDGRTTGLTAPNGVAQVDVIEHALRAGKLEASSIQFVETHGTGTSLGDPIEVSALTRLMSARHGAEPCYLGAVKTNLGHLEAAAGMAGLVKTVLALRHAVIPPNLYCERVNPHIKLEGSGLALPLELTPWPAVEGARHAAVSSFGFGGSNAHVVLESVESLRMPRGLGHEREGSRRGQFMLPLSAKSIEGLRALAARYAVQLEEAGIADLASLCAEASTGRSHFRFRKGILAKDVASARAALARLAEGKTQPYDCIAASNRTAKPRMAWLFTGQGAQYIGMGRSLYASSKPFRAAIDRCAELLTPALGRDLRALMYCEDSAEALERLSDTRFSQPALFAIGCALAEHWQAWGVTPSHVAGHSLGEYVAAWYAGVFSLEDALKLVEARGRLMATMGGRGTMLAIDASASVVEPKLAPGLCIAAFNGPQQVVAAGSEKGIEQLEATMAALGVATQRLQVSCAFHSPLMEPMLEEFRQIAQSVAYKRPKIAVVSNVTGQLEKASLATPEYWVNHIRLPVQFERSVKTLVAEGCQTFLEIGPRPILAALGQASAGGEQFAWLPSLRLKQDDWAVLLGSLGALYERGIALDWSVVYRAVERTELRAPSYPFQRKYLRRDRSLEVRATEVMQATSVGTESAPADRELIELFRTQNHLLASYLFRRGEGAPQAASAQTSLVRPLVVPAIAAGARDDEPALRVDDTPAPRELRELVLATIAEVGATRIEDIDGQHSLIDDLGFDSLMLASLLEKLGRQAPEMWTPEFRKQLISQVAAKATVNELLATFGATVKGDKVTDELAPRAVKAASGVSAPQPRPANGAHEADRESVRDNTPLEETPEVRAIADRVASAGDTNMFFRINDGIPTSTTMIDGRQLINYSSYNYLGLNGHPEVLAAVQVALERYGTSASASRIIAGEKPLHQELERALCDLLGTEDSIVYIGGYSANQATISHLLGAGDLVLHDSLAHNSIIQGAVASGAARRPFPHNDVEALATFLRKNRSRYRRVLVVIEGIYSQDGDIPMLPEFIALREEHNVWLMVDEAHSIGVLGRTGGGIRQHFGVDAAGVDLWMGTLSKSFASCGGYIAGRRGLVRYLKYTAPGFVYACGITPPNAASALAAIQVMQREPERVERLRKRAELFQVLAQESGLDTGLSVGTPIVPIIIGDSERTIQLSHQLYQAGINALPIVHPAVEEERARIRFFITECHSPAQIRHTVEVLENLLGKSRRDSVGRATYLDAAEE